MFITEVNMVVAFFKLDWILGFQDEIIFILEDL